MENYIYEIYQLIPSILNPGEYIKKHIHTLTDEDQASHFYGVISKENPKCSFCIDVLNLPKAVTKMTKEKIREINKMKKMLKENLIINQMKMNQLNVVK